MDSKIIILKIGGSTISTSEENLFDFDQVNKLKDVLVKFIEQGYKFILVTGGGYIARKYRNLLKPHNFSEYDLHYVGTAACSLNATMLRGMLTDYAEDRIFTFSDFNKEEPIILNKSVLVAGGGNPGPSSDWDAAYLCKYSNSKVVISMKDVGGVLTEDPDINPNAKLIEKLTWDEYLNVIGNPQDHSPGGDFPVDPLAARYCKTNGISFKILDGKDLSSLTNAIQEISFNGSTVS